LSFLEGDETVEACVFGFIDNAHAAATQLLDDVVVREGLADHGLADQICPIKFWAIEFWTIEFWPIEFWSIKEKPARVRPY
jgi:hypothetical protein